MRVRRPHAPRGASWGRVAVATAIALAGCEVMAGRSGAVPTPPASCQLQERGPMSASRAAQSAARLVAAMSLEEKVAFLGLQPVPTLRIQQANPGVPRLCVPPIMLRDGPVGLAAAARGVTAFPSTLNLASTFDTALARGYGAALGAEARGQGVMAIQGPGLNVSVFDNWGRGFENLGEDPLLTSTLGAQIVAGVQSTGEIAMAKHLSVYDQETTRGTIDSHVSPRAREELYLAPFRAAARVGVGSFMCAIGKVDGTEACSDAAAISEMASEGFGGFVRTDAGATTDEVAALKSGVDLFRPYDPAPIRAALDDATLDVSVLDRAVRDVLRVMYRFGDVHWPALANASLRVSTPASQSLSLAIAARSVVLLKNDGTLPIHQHRTGAVAVIGAAAHLDPVLSGTGSSQVYDPHPVTDLQGIVHVAGSANVTYVPAASTAGVDQLLAGPASPLPSVPGFQEAPLELGPADVGLVDLSYWSTSPARLLLDGVAVAQNPQTTSGRPVRFGTSVRVSPGHHDLVVQWSAKSDPPVVSAQPVDGLIEGAADAARAARVAIVVVGARDGEGYDRPTLALPGYQDELVAAVAAANRRTVVVVHSGGPVLMPWLGSVAAVLEAWYPGQVAGTALADVLTGRVNPSGRLPVAFPTSDASAAMIPATTWPSPPKSADLVALGDLAVGSRWYAGRRLEPRFPFGFGLSYTSFAVGAPRASIAAGTVLLRFPVANTGSRVGRVTVLANVTFPWGAGEPAGQLKGFASAVLQPHRAAPLRIAIPLSALRTWVAGRWRPALGEYLFEVGGRTVSLRLHRAAGR